MGQTYDLKVTYFLSKIQFLYFYLANLMFCFLTMAILFFFTVKYTYVLYILVYVIFHNEFLCKDAHSC